MIDSRICTTTNHYTQLYFAYIILSKLHRGITANLCVKRVYGCWFDGVSYPKTGGGEDVDYCLLLHRVSGKQLISVPTATAYHSIWLKPLKQIYNWSYGDAVLLVKWSEHTYYNLPYTIQIVILWLIYTLFMSSSKPYSLLVMLVFYICDTLYLWSFYNQRRLQQHHLHNTPCLSALYAGFINQLQDIGHTIGPFRMYGICGFKYILLRFDWFCSREPNGIICERNNAIRRLVSCIITTVCSMLFINNAGVLLNRYC